MKKHWIGVVLLLALISCEHFKSNHPQAKTLAVDALTGEDIRLYADSVDSHLSEYEKLQSLLYNSENSSFYVTRYETNNKPLLYIKNNKVDQFGDFESRYYFKNGELIFHTEQRISSIINQPSTFKRDYFRSNILFYSEAKSSENPNGLVSALFAKVEADKTDYESSIKEMENAINQDDKFDLTFEGIAEYPKAKYLILSRNEVNAYRAPVLVQNEHEDDFIREISAHPSKYQGRKLDLRWLYENGEPVYISGTFKKY